MNGPMPGSTCAGVAWGGGARAILVSLRVPLRTGKTSRALAAEIFLLHEAERHSSAPSRLDNKVRSLPF